MDSLSLADVFWSALVLAGVSAQVLDARARRRGDRAQVAPPVAPSEVPSGAPSTMPSGVAPDLAERRLTLA